MVAAGLLLSGCAADPKGADFATMSQQAGPPRAGQSRIVVMREKVFVGAIDSGWDVKLDGAKLGDLKAGSYIYGDRPAGAHRLSTSAALFPGDTNQEIRTAPDKTYFYMVRPSERSKALTASMAIGGVAGALVGSAITSNSNNPGPVDFVAVEEGEARTAIAELRLAE